MSSDRPKQNAKFFFCKIQINWNLSKFGVFFKYWYFWCVNHVTPWICIFVDAFCGIFFRQMSAKIKFPLIFKTLFSIDSGSFWIYNLGNHLFEAFKSLKKCNSGLANLGEKSSGPFFRCYFCILSPRRNLWISSG